MRCRARRKARPWRLRIETSAGDAQAGMACVGRRQKRAVADAAQSVSTIAEPGDESLYYAPLQIIYQRRVCAKEILNMSRYTAAIVGCGSIGSALMEGYNLADDVEVVAVCDPSIARRVVTYHN